MKDLKVFCLFTLFIASGCMSLTWVGYKKPSNSSFVDVNGSKNCFRIGVQNLNDKHQKAILEAASEVCSIINDVEFRKKVISRKWLKSCEFSSDSTKLESGESVYNTLTNNIVIFSIYARNPLGAIAQAQKKDGPDSVFSRIAIRPDRINNWNSKDDLLKAELINTLAHEITHIVSYDYQDKGHGSNCNENELVSYGIGNLAEEIWLMKNAGKKSSRNLL